MKKKIAKIIVLMLTGVLLVGALCACGKKDLFDVDGLKNSAQEKEFNGEEMPDYYEDYLK